MKPTFAVSPENQMTPCSFNPRVLNYRFTRLYKHVCQDSPEIQATATLGFLRVAVRFQTKLRLQMGLVVRVLTPCSSGSSIQSHWP